MTEQPTTYHKRDESIPTWSPALEEQQVRGNVFLTGIGLCVCGQEWWVQAKRVRGLIVDGATESCIDQGTTRGAVWELGQAQAAFQTAMLKSIAQLGEAITRALPIKPYRGSF